MTNHIGVVYVEKKTELSGFIGSGMKWDETRQDNDVTDSIGLVFAKNDNKILRLIEPSATCDKTT